MRGDKTPLLQYYKEITMYGKSGSKMPVKKPVSKKKGK
jgi:hypothetical protein